jgi:hypothetical protein
MVTHGGQLKPGFTPDVAAIAMADASAWDPDLAPAYRCPLSVTINEKPVLSSELIVTAPHPPLRNCGGIIGVSVVPNGSSSKRLLIRVLATRSSGPAP